MSLVAYLEITDEELQPDAPILSSIGIRFRDNPIAIATRDSNAPWLNGVGASQLLTGSGNWTVPAEVFRVRAWLFGAGGGGGGGASTGTGNGSTGGSTTFGAATASGGSGGYGSRKSLTSGGEFQGNGSQGARRAGAAGGRGGVAAFTNEIDGVMNSYTGVSGSPGQLTMTVLTVTPGQSISYSAGSGGGAGAGHDGGGSGDASGDSGGNGFIYLEW